MEWLPRVAMKSFTFSDRNRMVERIGLSRVERRVGWKRALDGGEVWGRRVALVSGEDPIALPPAFPRPGAGPLLSRSGRVL